MSDLMKINQTGESKWFTNEEIAAGFECSEEAIRSCKFDNKDYFIEEIDWKMAAVSQPTAADSFVGVPTKHTQGGRPPTLWSEIGVLKLAEKMKLTAKAQLFLLQYRVQEAKREMMANVIPMIQTTQEENLKLRDELYRTERTLEAYVYDVKKTAMFSENKTNINIKAVKKMLEQFKQDQYWRTDLKHLTVLEFVEACNLEGMLPKPQLRTLAKVAIYWSKKFKADIDPRGQSRLSLIYGGKGDVLNVGIRTDVMFMVWDMQNTMVPSYVKKQRNLYDAHKRGS